MELVDDVVTVDDADLRATMTLIAESVGVLVEPAGAASVAALARHPEKITGDRVAVLLTGAAA
jgi:threonine dehydratase